MPTVLLRAISLTWWPIGWVLGAALAVSVVLLARRPYRRGRLPFVAAAAGAAVVVVRLLVPASVDVARIPPSFYAWAALWFAVVGVAVAGWRGRPRRWRWGAAGAVGLAAVLVAQQVNAWFAYVPTAGDLLGAPLLGQTELGRWQAADRPSPAATGAVVPVELPASRSAFRHRRAMVWLPPDLQPADDPLRVRADAARRPVVMLLAGTPGAPDDMVRAGDFAAVAARFAAGHGGRAPIIVMPDHNGGFAADSECVGHHGQAEQYLTEDVPEGMAVLFGTRRDHWGLIGYSEGGTCAVMLALRHAELFPVFVDISGDERPNLGSGRRRDRLALEQLYGGDATAAAEHDPRWLLAHRRYDDVHGWFIAGRSDRPARRAAASLAPAAAAAGVDVRWSEATGHHSFGFVHRVAPESLDWVVANLAATVPQGAS